MKICKNCGKEILHYTIFFPFCSFECETEYEAEIDKKEERDI